MSDQRKCHVRIDDEVNCSIFGLSGTDLNFLYDQYGVYRHGYVHSKLYKLGRWDGKQRFFSKTGVTYLYLLPAILKHLMKRGYAFEVTDNRSPSAKPPEIDQHVFKHVIHPETGNPIELRDYQYQNVNKLIKHNNGVIVAGTGAGKTLLCAALVDAYGKTGYRTITIVPSGDLISNTWDDYVNCGLDAGRCGDGLMETDHTHVVATWQTLQHHPELLRGFHVVVVDECHGARGQKLQDLLLNHASHVSFRFGVTGTLPKDPAELMQVLTALGPERGRIEAHELMEMGVLAQLDIEILQLQEDLRVEHADYQERTGRTVPYKDFVDQYFPDYKAEKEYLARNPERCSWIANFLRKLAEQPKGNTLCMVSSIAAARALGKLLPHAIIVNGSDMDDTAERKKVYKSFATNDNLLVIATVHIASTGLNIPRIFNFVTIDIGKSFIRVIQSIGRSVRKARDKDSVTMYDICSSLKNGRKHLKDRVKFYVEAKYRHSTKKVQYR